MDDSKLKKEMYERRNNYVEKRNRENSEILEGVLTDEQIDFIETVCSMRHKIHTGREHLFISEADNTEEWEFIDNLKENIKKLNLPEINEDELLRIDCYTTEVDVDYNDMDYDEALDEFYDQIEKLNYKLERWLFKIDEQYGTNYAPSGKYRYMEDYKQTKSKAKQDEEEM